MVIGYWSSLELPSGLSCTVFGLFANYRFVALKVGLRGLWSTASLRAWAYQRFLTFCSIFRLLGVSSESQCKGKNFSLRSTNVSPVFFIILRFFFDRPDNPGGHLVIWSFVKIEKRCCQNRHYNINILFIYSEQWPRFRNRKWPNDLDQMTTWFFYVNNV